MTTSRSCLWSAATLVLALVNVFRNPFPTLASFLAPHHPDRFVLVMLLPFVTLFFLYLSLRSWLKACPGHSRAVELSGAIFVVVWFVLMGAMR